MRKFFFTPLIAFSFVVVSTIAFAQNLPPQGWQGYGEKDWFVDVPDWDVLNIRSKPHHTSAQVGFLKAGEVVGIQDTDSSWSFVSSSNNGGWVNAKYLCDFNSVPCKHITKSLPDNQTSSNKKQIESSISTYNTESDVVSEPVVVSSTPDFEGEFSKLKSIYRENDSCFDALKQRNEILGISMQLEQNDPQAFRNVYNKLAECTEKLNDKNVKALTYSIEEMDLNSTQKSRLNNFSNEYLLVLEDSIGMIQIGQLLGISYE